MSIGVDRAMAVMPGDLWRLRQAYGVSWTGVYIGGACNAGRGWTRLLLESLARIGFSFLPIYVGPQTADVCEDHELTEQRGLADGDEAVALMAGLDLAAIHSLPCALDIEASTYTNEPQSALAYAAAWAERVSEHGCAPILYGSRAMVEALALFQNVFDGIWLADWMAQGPALRLTTDDMPVSEAERARFPLLAWQYSGSFNVPETSGPCDFNVANFGMASTHAALTMGVVPFDRNAAKGDDDMTDEQLAEIVGAIKGAANSTMIWLARQQRGLDVVSGKPLDKIDTTTDPGKA